MELGIVRQIGETRTDWEGCASTAAACSMGAPTAPSATSVRRSAAGSAFTWEESRARALGEAVERFCAAVYDERTFVLDCQRNLAPEASIPRPSPCSRPLNTVSRALRSNPSPKRRESPGRGATRCCSGRRFSCPRPSCIVHIGRSRVKPRLAISPPRGWPAATRSPTRSSTGCTKPWNATPS